MKYNDFIKTLQEELNENGLRIKQSDLKKIFECMSNVILDNIDEEEIIKIREFIVFKLIEVPSKVLPNGTHTDKQLSMKIEMTDFYKKKIKERLNK